MADRNKNMRLKEKLPNDAILYSKEIRNILMSTNTYYNCLKEYNSLLCDVADLFYNIGIRNPLAISELYKLYLDEGCFSYKGKNEYHLFNNDYFDYLSELYGTRVMTGYSICRHNAGMLTDLINVMGGRASNIFVSPIENPSKSNTKDLFLLKREKYDHLVTGIIENKTKYLYDPTFDIDKRLILFKTKKINNLNLNSRLCAQYYNSNFVCAISTQNFNPTLHFNYNNEKNVIDFMNANPKINRFDFYDELVADVIKLHNSNKQRYLMKKFYEKESERLKKIKRYNDILVPHSDMLRKFKTK